MDKTYRDEFERLFLIEQLPEPLTRADRHLQIFDNYIFETRLRLRSVRVPETRAWTWILQQKFPVDAESKHWKIAEIYLNETEYHTLATFEGNEIRKNRHFFEFEGRQIEIDLHIGALWGLNLAKVVFETLEELEKFEPPPFMILEVTGAEFFRGVNLVGKSFADVQAEVARLVERSHSPDTPIREIARENE